MQDQPLVLVVEDDLLLGQAYASFLEDLPCRLLHTTTGREALEILEQRQPDILLLDLLLPDIHGQTILEWVQKKALPTISVVITGESSTDVAVNAMRAGATDYLVKPMDANRLQTTVRNMLDRVKLQRRLNHAENLLPENRFEGFIGGSPAMQLVYRIIDSAARSEATVFITGESGTGKELCAEALHRRSHRNGGPFVVLNCAAIPRDLMESELFGHSKGAFTGASADRRGAADQADGGTLFFDEICELAPDMQAKLLRFVQTRSYQPVGSAQPRQANVRFVCATNKDPWSEVQAGNFREDLYYRFYVVPLEMPPLCRREGDIGLLAEHFLTHFAGQQGKRFEGFSPEACKRLTAYPWPGNVRELQNTIHNLAVMQDGGLIQPGMLQLMDGRTASRPEPADQAASATNGAIRPLWEEEREIIERAIRFCDGNVAEAADRLGISDSTIYRKRQKWESA